MAFFSCDLLQQPEINEAGDEAVGSGVGDIEKLLDLRHIEDWALVEVFKDSVSVASSPPEFLGDTLAVLLAQVQDLAGSFGGFAAYAEYAVDKEVEPALPIAVVAYGLQPLVVFAAVLLEVVGEVENGVLEDALCAEEKGDEQAPDPPVAVEEGVDGFKLDMREAYLHERGKVAGVLEEVFQCGKRRRDLPRRRGERRWHSARYNPAGRSNFDRSAVRQALVGCRASRRADICEYRVSDGRTTATRAAA